MFHAGDGNLHPLILYDANQPGELERTEEFGAEILKLCVEVGGVLTGEHGVGVEKRDLMPVMFNEDDLNQQQRVKCAFDPDPDPQPRQGVSPASPLRRARPHAHPPRPAPLPGPAAVLAWSAEKTGTGAAITKEQPPARPTILLGMGAPQVHRRWSRTWRTSMPQPGRFRLYSVAPGLILAA